MYEWPRILTKKSSVPRVGSGFRCYAPPCFVEIASPGRFIAMLRIATTCYLFFVRKEKVTEKKSPAYVLLPYVITSRSLKILTRNCVAQTTNFWRSLLYAMTDKILLRFNFDTLHWPSLYLKFDRLGNVCWKFFGKSGRKIWNCNIYSILAARIIKSKI